MPTYRALHLLGAQKSAERADWRGLVRYTAPTLDKIVPRVDLLALQQQNVTVVLSERQLALENMPAVDVTCEPVPNESPEAPPADAPKALAPGSSPADAWAEARRKDALARPPRPWDD